MIDSKQQSKLTEYLSGFVSDHKKNRIKEVLASRTRHIAVVLEDIYKPHNASAVLRTCECLGIQDVHIVEDRNQYDVNPYVTRGSAKWLTLNKYDHANQSNIEACIGKLKLDGYQVISTSPVGSMEINDISIDCKTAVVFGTEETGVSEYVKNNSDGLLRIPMYGFTESFNISVSAGIILNTMVEALKKSGVNWNLTDSEKRLLTDEWYKKCIKHVDALIKDFEQNMRNETSN